MMSYESSRIPAGRLNEARALLKAMGIDPVDLIRQAIGSTQVPTFAEYIPEVARAVPESTRTAYGTYWNRVIETWGPRPITAATPLEISQLAESMKSNAVKRRNGRDGRGAAEHLIAALRCMYNRAVADRLIEASDNPAIRVPKPRRLPSNRLALPNSRLAEICHVAATTGNDPELDTLILRVHMETACRRGGALALSPDDLDPEQCLAQLHEKAGTSRWQPVSPTLMTHLLVHARSRGGLESGQPVLRYSHGRAITARRYDTMWERLGEHLPWVKAQNVSPHWIRYTVLTWVERRFGFAVAQAYAGHAENNRASHAMAATGTYVRARLPEVAAALATLTGESHPLAPDAGSGR